MKECSECKGKINEEANKCYQCGSFQNWKKHIGPLTIATGLLLTWLSIVFTWLSILNVPSIKEIFSTPKAELRLSIFDSDYEHVSFMVSNVGNSPAAYFETKISVGLELGSSKTFYLKSDLDKKLIEPNHAYVVHASNGGVIPHMIPHEIQYMYNKRYGKIEENCHLILEYIQLNGIKEYLYYPFSCMSIESNENLFDDN